MAINDISLTTGMRSNLLSLQNTVTLLDRTQNRLSSGKKVNTAMDNPVSYFAAQALNSRAAIIDGLKDAMGQAVQTITAADKGITALSTMIEQAKGLAQSAQSAEAGTTPTAFAGTAGDAITYSTVSLTIGAVTTGQTFTLGGVTLLAVTDAADVDDTHFLNTAAGLAEAITSNTTLAAAGYVVAEAAGTIDISLNGVDITVGSVGGNATGLTAAIDTAHAEVMSVTISGTAYTGASAATATLAATALQTVLVTALSDVGSATVSAAGAVEVTYDYVPSDEMTSIVNQYNTLRTQMDELAEDSGYKGKNLLNSATLTVKFEGTTLDVVGFNGKTGGVLAIAEANATTWGNTAGAIDLAVTSLDTASTTLRSEASKLSGNLSIISVRQSFSQNMINTLNAGSDLLTLADSNEEGANMLMLQTRQSLSTTALSLSAQAAQSVLKLFG